MPASVNELVQALLSPHAAEHGFYAERVGQMLDGLLGRPSVAPPEPVTAQMPSALPPPQNLPVLVPAAKVTPPDIQAFAAPNAASLVWPSSPPPASGGPHSYPPLPPAFARSYPPPPPRSFRVPEPPPPLQAQRQATPPPPHSEGSRAPLSHSQHAPTEPPRSQQLRGLTPSVPPVGAAVGSYPPPVSMRQAPAVDAPFATPSFPPPPGVPSGSDDIDLDLRPSFIGRLKRLFGKKRPPEF